ncbi:MAG: putative Ig domain-containing protein, partial [Poseidonia sp.]
IGSMGSSTWKDRPTKTNNLGSDAVSVSMGEQHTCAVLDTGVLKCWGRNNHGQVGNGPGGDEDTPTTINVGSGRTTTSVYLGYHHTCAILDDQSVKCWGRNQDGELGVGSTTSSFNSPQSINSLGTNRHAVSLALGQGFTCALLDDGSIKCWGQDNFGQRGDGGGYGSDIRSPPSSAISLPTGRTATQISAGEFHVCALLDDASVVCWGKNTEGQLGDGTTSHRTSPVATSSFGSGHTVSYVSAGYDHVCALLTDGGVRCWGSNNNGQLGDGTTTDRSSPPSTDVNLGSGYTAIGISSGGGHTCAMLNDGDMKCWGARGSGQLGDDSNFASSDQTTPVFVHGTRVWQEGQFLTSPDVSGATCGISPALPTGMSLTSGTCAITGTPTVTAVNATYTVWANISGQSFSGQVWLEVGLNTPILSYSPTSYTYTKDSAISPVIPTNTGGEISTWELEGGLLPAGLNFGTSNGTFWGTPTAIVSASTYTVWANNSAGSGSTTITLTVNDVAPSITFTPSSLILATGAAMTPITASNSGGSIVSCSVSPSLPSGLSLSNTCTLSGTPTVASSAATYTITATNTGGSDTATFSLTVQASGGTLTISPTSREGSVNSALANITMSYTHTASNYGWTSGVSNTTTSLATNFDRGSGDHWLGADSGEQGELVVVYARNDSTTTTHSLAMFYRWNGTWTETILDNGTNTGHHPSVAIDRQGAIHIAYIDDNNDKLRYATNASGSWVFTTLGNSTIDLDNEGDPRLGRGTAIVVHPITDAVHVVATNYVNSSRGLSYHTNEGGSWVNETITDMTKDEGHDPAMAMDADGNLYVAHYCSTSCNDLRLSSRIDGVWQNETVSSSGDIGSTPDIAIDSQGTIHIVSRYDANGGRIHLHSGTPGSWTAQTGLSGNYAHWPVVEVDSNDAVHIAYHYAWIAKDVMYMTNASGSWSTPSKVEEYGGWGSVMAIDANDDIFIPNIHASTVSHDDELQLTTVQGYGQGLTARPIFDISPMLPDGLVMNWRNGTISGTPTEALANTSFTVTVTALGATTSGTFTLFITGEPGIIAYTDIQATNRTVITTATPSFTNNSTSGTTTSWAISPSLPSGLSFGTTNGSIWGTPTLEQIKTSYTVWANNTAGSSSTTINITIGPAAPGDFEYIPEDNVLFNTTYAHLAPSFVNITTGSGTNWQVGSSDTGPGSNFAFNINGVVYFDAGSNEKLWAYNPTTNTSWKVSNTVTWVGEHMAYAVEDTIYFSGHTSGTGREFYAYNTTNQTLWLVSDIRSGSTSSEPGNGGSAQDGDVLFFMAYSGTTTKWFSYNHSNGTLTSKYVYASSGGTAE